MSTETSIAALLLVNRLTDVAGASPLTAREYWDLLALIDDPAQLMGLDVQGLEAVGLAPLLAERVARLLDAGVGFAFERERVEAGGLQLLSTFDDRFPLRLRSRLGTVCPAFLLAAGALPSPDDSGLGVVGSRDVTEAGVLVAQAAASSAARRGAWVVSGLARGVDQAAMSAALDADGRVLGIPAEGLSKVTRTASIRRYVTNDRSCLLSPYGPKAPFSAANAMGRNKIIYAMSDQTLVVASDRETGGTWAGATEALRREFGSVSVWVGDGAGPGNAALVSKGGRPISALDDLERFVELEHPEPIGQLTLDTLVADLGVTVPASSGHRRQRNRR